MARRAADRGPGDRRRHPLGVGPDHRHRHAGRDLRRGSTRPIPRRGLCPAELPDDGRRVIFVVLLFLPRSSSSPSPSASSHRPACSRRRGRRSRGPRSRRRPADDHVAVSRGATELNGNRSRTVQYLTPGCQRDRWYCRGSSRQPQRAISLRRTQCGCSARSPLGRRCWCCSAPARRVGAAASRRSRSARMDSTRRASSPRCTRRSSRPTATRSIEPASDSARDVTNAALESGQIDLKPEYLGSGLAKLAPGTQTTSPDTNKQLLAEAWPARAAG